MYVSRTTGNKKPGKSHNVERRVSSVAHYDIIEATIGDTFIFAKHPNSDTKDVHKNTEMSVGNRSPNPPFEEPRDDHLFSPNKVEEDLESRVTAKVVD